jgi:hypothetical protein
MKFFRELYDFNYNYVKECSSLMRYLNELILKGGVKHVSLLLVISIDSDHMVFFFMHADALAELVLNRVEDIVRMSFSTQYAICIFCIRSIFAWLSCSPLFFATKNASSSFPFLSFGRLESY